MKHFTTLIASLLISLTTLTAQTFTFDFATDNQGWSGDFADYPAGDSIGYELEFVRTTLPAPLDTDKFALKISGNNHSDDLFMFIKRKITGLLPNTTYQLLIDVEFAPKCTDECCWCRRCTRRRRDDEVRRYAHRTHENQRRRGLCHEC